ncbi:ENTP1 diphosphohydrolase, partial [Atractosteus spatula]|nr:ENTP1 diphosphohydrolase [Atractosteus spatula]
LLEMKKNPWHSPWVIALAVFIALGIIALVTTAVVQNKPLPKKFKYGIVLDAGSSHTSLYIYEWPAEKQNDTGVVKQLHVCHVQGPGISSYSADPKRAGASLQECMNEAKVKIPERRHNETPVYLGATAGMRLLRKENSSASDKVLSSVAQSLQSYPFQYHGARIITGQEEGAYGWITVNYLSEKFKQAWQFFQTPSTMGALDLGGASTQITFVPHEEVVSKDNALDFRLYGNDYKVYTHSFLCYGKDQALKVVLAEQLQEKDDNVLVNPCFNKGYTKNMSLSNIYSSPCVSTRRNISHFFHRGTGNATQCQESIRKIFNFTGCRWPSCSFNGIYQPQLQGSFGIIGNSEYLIVLAIYFTCRLLQNSLSLSCQQAFSAFYFVMNFLNLTTTTLEGAKEKLAAYCSLSWKDVKQNYPKIKDKYLEEYCFSGTYILTLLEEGYNFTSENWNNIAFIKKIGDSDAGWTLGYMLNLTNLIPAESPAVPPLPHAGYVAMMVLFSLLLVVLFVIGYKCFGRPSCNSQKYTI